ALHAQVRIAPESKPGNFSQVLVADVKAAGEGDAAVNHQNFPMIAHVDLDAPPQGIERQEFPALAAGIPKSLESPPVQSIRTHGVIQQANLDSLFGFLAEKIQHSPTCLI